MKTKRKKILVLGIGNYLMGDEGIGVHIAEQLMDEPWLNADVVDGGTGGFYLLDYFERYENIILIDATLDNNPPGTIRLIRPRFSEDFPQAMSTHDIGLKDMVRALQLMGKMPNIHLFVVTIESLQQQGIELTPEITGVMDELKEKIHSLIKTISRETKELPKEVTVAA